MCSRASERDTLGIRVGSGMNSGWSSVIYYILFIYGNDQYPLTTINSNLGDACSMGWQKPISQLVTLPECKAASRVALGAVSFEVRARTQTFPATSPRTLTGGATPDSLGLSATPKVALESVVAYETHEARWISSLRNGRESNCKFGTYRASATKNHCAPIGFESPATIRIDKNEDRTCQSSRRSRVRVLLASRMDTLTIFLAVV